MGQTDGTPTGDPNVNPVAPQQPQQPYYEQPNNTQPYPEQSPVPTNYAMPPPYAQAVPQGYPMQQMYPPQQPYVDPSMQANYAQVPYPQPYGQQPYPPQGYAPQGYPPQGYVQPMPYGQPQPQQIVIMQPMQVSDPRRDIDRDIGSSDYVVGGFFLGFCLPFWSLICACSFPKLRLKYGILMGNATAFGFAVFIFFIMAIVFTSTLVPSMCDYSQSECESDVVAGSNSEMWRDDTSRCSSCERSYTSTNPGPQSLSCAECVCDYTQYRCDAVKSPMIAYWVLAVIYAVLFGVCVHFARKYRRQINHRVYGH